MFFFGPEDGGRYLHLGQVRGPDGRTGDLRTFLPGETHHGPGFGSPQIEIGSTWTTDVHPRWHDEPGYDGPSANRFKVELQITDRESGEVGTITAYGRGAFTGDSTAGDYKFALQMLEGEKQRMILGDHTYLIDFDPGVTMDRRFTSLFANVDVTSANTPEPATLVLAGVGLAGAGLLRLRLRFAAR